MERTKRFRSLRGLILGALALVSLWAALIFGTTGRYLTPIREELGEGPEGSARVGIGVEGRPEELPAWSIAPRAEGRAVFLLVHGLAGHPAAWNGLAEALHRRGFGVVIPFMRGHTESPVRTINLGPGEAEEVVAAARWVQRTHPGSPIIPVGISLGGAAVWLASAQAPDLFAAVVTEGAFARLAWASRDTIGRMPLRFAVEAPVRALMRQKLGFGEEEVRPDLAAKVWRGRPALVIHAEQDGMFGPRHALALAEASGAEIWTVPGARHAMALFSDIEAAADRLLALADRVEA